MAKAFIEGEEMLCPAMLCQILFQSLAAVRTLNLIGQPVSGADNYVKKGLGGVDRRI